MRVEKLLLGLIILPLTVAVLIILLPLILLFGVFSLVTGRPMGATFVKMAPFGSKPSPDNQKDDVIDVEVIHSENSGTEDDISRRSLR